MSPAIAAFILIVSLSVVSRAHSQQLECDEQAQSGASEALLNEGFQPIGTTQTTIGNSTWGITVAPSFHSTIIYSHPDHRVAFATCAGLIRHPVKEAFYSVETSLDYNGFPFSYELNGQAFIKVSPTIDLLGQLMVKFDLIFARVINSSSSNQIYREKLSKSIPELRDSIRKDGYFSNFNFIKVNLPESGKGTVSGPPIQRVAQSPNCLDLEPPALPFEILPIESSISISYQDLSVGFALRQCRQIAATENILAVKKASSNCFNAHGVPSKSQIENQWSVSGREKKEFICTSKQRVSCFPRSIEDRVQTSCQFSELEPTTPVETSLVSSGR
jgi:hypothetical protein